MGQVVCAAPPSEPARFAGETYGHCRAQAILVSFRRRGVCSSHLLAVGPALSTAQRFRRCGRSQSCLPRLLLCPPLRQAQRARRAARQTAPWAVRQAAQRAARQAAWRVLLWMARRVWQRARWVLWWAWPVDRDPVAPPARAVPSTRGAAPRGRALPRVKERTGYGAEGTGACVSCITVD